MTEDQFHHYARFIATLGRLNIASPLRRFIMLSITRERLME